MPSSIFFTKDSKFSLCFYIAALLTMFSGPVFSQTLLKHDFNDGTLGPFETVSTGNGNTVSIVNNRAETHWEERFYNGKGWTRKAEFRAQGNAYRFTRELWVGFDIKLHSDYMATNRNTDASLLQLFGFDDSQSRFGPTAMIKFGEGDMTWFHWIDDNQGTKKNFRVQANFPKDRFVSVVLHVILSKSNKGIVEVWTDGIKRMSLSGQNFGWGSIDPNGNQYNQSYTTLSFGQYNYRSVAANDDTWREDNHRFDGYVDNETRTVTYDNITIWNGPDGYQMVNPSPEIDNEKIVHIRKSNASSFAIDGNHGGGNAQNVYIWSQNSGNINQQWAELDRGNGYYSYQKKDTGFCLDGNNGGSNGQSIYLWTCDAENHNQHWKKVSLSNNYRLEKRNAPGYSIDGGNGGGDGHDLYLWSSSDQEKNQQWSFSEP